MGIFDKKDDDKRARPDFSNVQGGGSSTDPARDFPVNRPAGSDSGRRTYTIVSGDTLSKIAKRYYGKASEWNRIYDANRDTIKNPDLIYPGQTIVIPDDTSPQGGR